MNDISIDDILTTKCDVDLIDIVFTGTESELEDAIEDIKDTLRNRAFNSGLDTEPTFYIREGNTIYVICNPVVNEIRTVDGEVINRHNLHNEYHDFNIDMSFMKDDSSLNYTVKVPNPKLMTIPCPWLIARIVVAHE